MFDNKSEADEYDLKLERVEALSALIQETAQKSSLKIDETTADKMAETMISDHAEEMAAIFGGKKMRKPKPAKEKVVVDTSIDGEETDYE